MDDKEALERVAKMRAEKEAERLRRESERKDFMRVDPDLDYMLRKSRWRKNYMESNQNLMTVPGSVEWHNVKRAATRHSRFEYHKKKYEQAEVYALAAIQNGDEALIDEYTKASDKHLKECLMNAYAVNHIYGQFLVSAERLAGKNG